MAYPTNVNFRHTSGTLGLQPINESSSTQRHPLGFEVRAEASMVARRDWTLR